MQKKKRGRVPTKTTTMKMTFREIVMWTSFMLAFNFVGLSERDNTPLWYIGIAIGFMLLATVMAFSINRKEEREKICYTNFARGAERPSTRAKNVIVKQAQRKQGSRKASALWEEEQQLSK